jgi:hypothetical protein
MVVLSIGSDPVASGFISSMNRPDNSITGVTNLAYELAAKRVEFLRELVRTDSKLAFLANPTVEKSAEVYSHFGPCRCRRRTFVDAPPSGTAGPDEHYDRSPMTTGPRS